MTGTGSLQMLGGTISGGTLAISDLPLMQSGTISANVEGNVVGQADINKTGNGALTFSGGGAINSLYVTAGTVNVTGGSLTVATAVNMNAGHTGPATIDVSGGTLNLRKVWAPTMTPQSWWKAQVISSPRAATSRWARAITTPRA